MELLEAVNTVLPILGEHIVTRVEGARHPTVDLITGAIERKRKAVLSEGWWFNTATRTLSPDTEGYIATPAGIVAIYGEDCDVEIDGSRLFDLTNDSRIFSKPILVKLIKDIEFDKLPYSCAIYITYLAAYEVYLQDYGLDNTAQALRGEAGTYYQTFSQENMRKRRYNSAPSRSTGRFRSHLRR